MKKLVLVTIILLSALAGASEFGSALQQGVRQQGLAEAFTGLADDGEAVYYNHAGLVNLNGFEDMVMYSNQLGGMTQGMDEISANVTYLGHAQNFGEKYGSAGIRWYYRGYGQGSVFNSSEHNIQLGYGHSLKQYFKDKGNPYMQEFSAGLGLKILKWGFYDIDGQRFFSGSSDYSAWNLGWELSAYYKLLNNYSFGFVVKDLAYYRSKKADAGYSEPVDFRIGGAWKYNPESRDDVVALDLSGENNRYSLNLGSERFFDLQYQNLTDRIIARGGFVMGFDSYYSLALGFGYQLSNLGDRIELPIPMDLRFDYAFRMQTGEIDDTPVNNSFQLTFLFAPKSGPSANLPVENKVEVIQEENKQPADTAVDPAPPQTETKPEEVKQENTDKKNIPGKILIKENP